MTLTLASAATPAPKRQALVATAVASAAITMLMAGMLGMWLRFRAAADTRMSSDGLKVIKDWLPSDIKIPEVSSNTMLVGLFFGCVMAQWAVYAAKRDDSSHRSVALAVCLLMEVAIINAQVAVYSQMKIGVTDGAYQTMFYAITGVVVVLLAVGMAFTSMTWFRSVGGRDNDSHVVAAHALYWYVLTAVFCAVWFVVYVQK
jgi:heme/copper-type cytochrome/quinol oxidase subunit 3